MQADVKCYNRSYTTWHQPVSYVTHSYEYGQIDSCQNQVSADNYLMTISRAQMKDQSFCPYILADIVCLTYRFNIKTKLRRAGLSVGYQLFRVICASQIKVN